jgi:HK97 gp10 family phage protein
MTITVQVEGLEQVQAALRKLGADAEKLIGKAVTATALEINADVKKRIQRGPKTGVTYYRIPGDKYMTVRAGSADGTPVAFFAANGKANLSPKHTASARDQAPASDTGGLVKSIYFKQSGKMQATIGSRLAYAAYLEFGTTKIKPRPSWVPATEIGQKKLTQRIIKAIEKAAK